MLIKVKLIAVFKNAFLNMLPNLKPGLLPNISLNVNTHISSSSWTAFMHDRLNELPSFNQTYHFRNLIFDNFYKILYSSKSNNINHL